MGHPKAEWACFLLLTTTSTDWWLWLPSLGSPGRGYCGEPPAHFFRVSACSGLTFTKGVFSSMLLENPILIALSISCWRSLEAEMSSPTAESLQRSLQEWRGHFRSTSRLLSLTRSHTCSMWTISSFYPSKHWPHGPPQHLSNPVCSRLQEPSQTITPFAPHDPQSTEETWECSMDLIWLRWREKWFIIPF